MAKKILIADNELQVRELFYDLLTKKGYEVITAPGGAEAIAYCAKEVPDLVLLDINMPGMDGITATKQIKGFLPSARVVMLTGYDDIKLRSDAESAGASYYLLKQLIHKELKPLLKRLLKNEDLAI